MDQKSIINERYKIRKQLATQALRRLSPDERAALGWPKELKDEYEPAPEPILFRD